MASNKKNGPVVLVTGCSEGGMGYEFCKDFAARGCRVYATARKLDAMKGLQGVVAGMLLLDVTKPEDRVRTVQEVIARAGGIDILVNNAGHNSGLTALIDADLEYERVLFETNFWGAVYLSQLVGRHMAQNGKGLIINIGSIASFNRSPFLGFYCATKSALEAMTHALRQEMKPLGVRVLYVAPGFVSTRIAHQPGAQRSIQEQVWGKSPLAPLYRLYTTFMLKTLAAIQYGVPPDVFAKRLVSVALKPKPPPMWVSGSLSSIFYFMSHFLPYSWQDAIFELSMGSRGMRLGPAATSAANGKKDS